MTVGRAAVCVVGFLDREAGFLGDRLGGREPLGPDVAGPQRRTPDRERRGDEGSAPDGRRGTVVVGGRESRRRPPDDEVELPLLDRELELAGRGDRQALEVDGDASYGRL